MTTAQALRTEFDFSLPRGFVDSSGQVHSTGRMRMATARDELLAHKHRHVKSYPEYLSLVLLSQVITQLGEIKDITPEDLENMFTQDMAFLKDFYNRINQTGSMNIAVQCPKCDHNFELELALSGELLATP
ncbi:phage tail assembly protein [filamentous cyanobacterium LEGE 11480]|uniref:Phage tail assembly protein n=1 Tax=Romeriopsis navalis LEGE 11480 TaxID=2777977 RepID=A0A928VPQ2_9CYAN|nr:phage tail assembly protein [Romeriopsis navalis]MBE9031482.1 phage tail assembly protein [Romeriopsis navalis LEGE 11480]